MNGSVFSKGRYMNGVGFEILACTHITKLSPSYPAEAILHQTSTDHLLCTCPITPRMTSCIAPDKTLFFNFWVFFLFLHENVYSKYSLEAFGWGTSNEYPQHMFLKRNNKIVHVCVFSPLIWINETGDTFLTSLKIGFDIWYKVFLRDNLQEMSNPIFWEKVSIFQNAIWNVFQRCNTVPVSTELHLSRQKEREREREREDPGILGQREREREKTQEFCASTVCM